MGVGPVRSGTGGSCANSENLDDGMESAGGLDYEQHTAVLLALLRGQPYDRLASRG